MSDYKTKLCKTKQQQQNRTTLTGRRYLADWGAPVVMKLVFRTL